ncbi:hypothetical protein Dsin_012650 [Dipteronia sinensis]|uniref:Uncharacterized protein n=1 Tax=Dipteronia sinensis TaxID=43782 RepID=A0AAE0E9M6_9ROSI|nr:hypothetical protein Dsin_012650 [Dipteronia sinensis]
MGEYTLPFWANYRGLPPIHEIVWGHIRNLPGHGSPSSTDKGAASSQVFPVLSERCRNDLVHELEARITGDMELSLQGFLQQVFSVAEGYRPKVEDNILFRRGR